MNKKNITLLKAQSILMNDSDTMLLLCYYCVICLYLPANAFKHVWVEPLWAFRLQMLSGIKSAC